MERQTSRPAVQQVDWEVCRYSLGLALPRFVSEVFMSLLLLALCLVTPSSPTPAKPRPEQLARGARVVLEAIVKSAQANRRLPTPRKGEALTTYYVQSAARAARTLPDDEAGPAFLLALGVGLDTSDLLRTNPVTGPLWSKIESIDEWKARLGVLGKPTLYERHDLAQHFAVSAALTVATGASSAEAAGILKEILDANGGSGFSFADLAADLSGIHFAKLILEKPARLALLEMKFTTADHCLSPRGLVEGLQQKEFEKRYGSVNDKRFQTALEELKTRVGNLPGLKEEK